MKPFLRIWSEPRENPLDTGEYDEFVFYSCHNVYSFGPEKLQLNNLVNEIDDEEHLRELIKTVREGAVFWSDKTNAFYYPLFMLDHSGLTFSFHPFGDPWDSGMAAIAKITKENVDKLGNTFESFKKFKQLINDMNDFETKSQYGFTEIDLDTGDTINGCSGYDLDELTVAEVKNKMEKDFENTYSGFEIKYAIDHITSY